MNTSYEAEIHLPERSRASRAIALRSIASYRGTIVDPMRNRAFNYESQLERDFLYVALASRDVADVHEQPPPVFYMDHSGRRTQHTFDALLHLHDGRRIAVALKPSGRVTASGIGNTLDLIRAQVGSAFADLYVLRTEQHLHPDDVGDARLILRARGLVDPAVDRIAADFAANLHGWCRLIDLAHAVGPCGSGFNAVVRLIGSGVLVVKDGARISSGCLVRIRPN
ncbi:hypothetical protein [Xanthobacter agilis]|uniref:TnsA endonuclease N-terminal domain-containing protein n=1 Tax=Xanthobacter agilis TaxID=47492 RepID=A0ABU0LJM2_XANAG|nr:hypothetical protein [Xanthobacter agilis]MDQ0507340.1 hypothetical protein [Xanthobacter agilis]